MGDNVMGSFRTNRPPRGRRLGRGRGFRTFRLVRRWFRHESGGIERIAWPLTGSVCSFIVRSIPEGLMFREFSSIWEIQGETSLPNPVTGQSRRIDVYTCRAFAIAPKCSSHLGFGLVVLILSANPFCLQHTPGHTLRETHTDKGKLHLHHAGYAGPHQRGNSTPCGSFVPIGIPS